MYRRVAATGSEDWLTPLAKCESVRTLLFIDLDDEVLEDLALCQKQLVRESGWNVDEVAGAQLASSAAPDRCSLDLPFFLTMLGSAACAPLIRVACPLTQ